MVQWETQSTTFYNETTAHWMELSKPGSSMEHFSIALYKPR